MKPRMLQLLVFVLVLGAWGFAEALEPLKLYDNFEQVPINPDKWVGNEFQFGGITPEFALETTQGRSGHHLRILNRYYNQTNFDSGISFGLFRLAFRSPSTITAIRSRMQVRNFESTGCALNPSPTRASARIFGFFFNTNATIPGNAYLDVIAGVGLQRPSDSTAPPDVLEISYFVDLCLDPNCVESQNLGSGLLGTVTTDQWVSLLLQWDRHKHRFIFQRDRETPGVVRYQEGGLSLPDTAEPGVQLETLGVDHFVANCSTDPRPVGMVDALFDNVFVNQSALP